MKEIVFIENKEVVTDSLTVAETFSKEHKDVIKKIETMDCSPSFRQRNFAQCDYINDSATGINKNRRYKKYLIKRDGLVFLVMGFTGAKAAQFKEQYINEFNRMEEKLKELYRPSYMIDDPIERAKQWIVEQEERTKLEADKLVLGQRLAEAEPKLTYYDRILQSKSVLTVTQISKDYGMGPRELNKLLKEEGIQYKQSGQWFLYAKYQDKGYTKSTTHMDEGGNIRLNTKWTQKGRLFIHQLLESKNIFAVEDKADAAV